MSEAYQAEADLLWPTVPAGRSGASTYRLAAVPNVRAPRLLVPADRPRAAAASLLRFSSALGPREVLARGGFAALLRLGLGRRLPGVTLPEGGGSVRDHLAGVLGEPVEVSLGLGTARANRKPVLEVFDRRGRRLGFAKVGTTPAARALVDAEAAALRRLATADLPHDLLVPTLLDHGHWRGCSVLVMTTVPSSARPDRDTARVPDRYAAALAAAFAQPAARLTGTTWWSGLTGTPAGAHPDLDAALADGLARLAALDAAIDEPAGLGAWHGDWTPWNQSRTRHGLALWDWERFGTGVPVGLDRCHFAVAARLRRQGVDPRSVVDGLRHAGLDPARPTDARLGSAYLLTAAARYLGDGAGTTAAAAATGAAADLVADRARVVLDALAGWTAPTGSAVPR